jgi:hypothetical protein
LREHRELAERTRYAQAISGGPWCIPEHALQVIERGYHAKLAPELTAIGFAEPAGFLGIEGGAAAGDLP